VPGQKSLLPEREFLCGCVSKSAIPYLRLQSRFFVFPPSVLKKYFFFYKPLSFLPLLLLYKTITA